MATLSQQTYDQNPYYLRPNESTPQYTERVAAYNAGKNSTTTPTLTSTPSYVPRYTPSEQAATDYLGTFQSPQSVDEIQAQQMQRAQGEIDAINRQYDLYLAEQKTINEGRSRSTDAVSVLTGLAGSTEALRSANETTAINQRDNQRIQNERGLAIQSLLGRVRQSALEQARQQRLDARASAEDILKRRTERATEAAIQLANLAKSGVTAEGLKTTDPESYGHLVQTLGGESQVKAQFVLNIPQEQIIDKRVESGKWIFAYQNPITGQTRIETLDLGLPPQFTEHADLGNAVMFYEKGNPANNMIMPKGKIGGAASAASAGSAAGLADMQKTQGSIDLMKHALINATQLADAAGRSGIRKLGEAWFVGSTDYTQLVAETNTLRANVLTLFTDPNIKKFFGPQMSNVDVQLMTSAGTTLNPELQGPQKLQEELVRLADLIRRIEATLPVNNPQQINAKSIVTAPDGTVIEIID